MSPAFRRFLAEDGGRLAQERRARSSRSGHSANIPAGTTTSKISGLETETLALARKVLYVEGVGGQIDKGAWEKLPPTMRLEDFNHTFVWQRANQFLIGRIWSSVDGKGRARYPMVVCAHYSGATLSWGLERVLPGLVELEKSCRAAKTAAEVPDTCSDRARTALRGTLSQAGPNAAPAARCRGGALKHFVDDAVFGPNQQGWQRIIYGLQNRMAAFTTAKFDARDATAWAQHTRVPVAAGSPEQALLLWNEFFATQNLTAGAYPFHPGRGAILAGCDLRGTVVAGIFRPVRAVADALPMATEVPYELDEAFKSKAKRILADFQHADGLESLGKIRCGRDVIRRLEFIHAAMVQGQGLALAKMAGPAGSVFGCSTNPRRIENDGRSRPRHISTWRLNTAI